MDTKIKSLRELKRIISRLKSSGKKVAFTNGCFDIIHFGHVKYLQEAKRFADVLVVAVNSNSSTRRIKGKKRPIVSQASRAKIVAALESVDFVTIFYEKDPLKTIDALKPDILIKGGDWKRRDVVGSDFVRSYGGKVKIIPYVKGHSTTRLLKKIHSL